MNSSFFIFAWLASILYAFETVVGKLTGKYAASNPWLLNFFWLLFVLIFTLPVALYYGVGLPTHWVNIFLAGLFYALQAVLFFIALYKIDVSVFAPLNSFYPVIGVFLGVAMLHENITNFQYFLIAIICIFGILVSLDEKFSLKSYFFLQSFLQICQSMHKIHICIFRGRIRRKVFMDITISKPFGAHIIKVVTGL